MTTKRGRRPLMPSEIRKFEEKQNELQEKLSNLTWSGRLTAKTTLSVLQRIIDGDFEKDLIPKWIEDISNKEGNAHYDFFDRRFDLAKFERRLKRYGRKLVERWQSLGLEPHFFPKTLVIPGWEKTKYQAKYPLQIAKNIVLDLQIDGQLMPVEEVRLEGITVLVDTRMKPRYQSGKQMFEKDNLLGPIIRKLRQQGKIAEYKKGFPSSRFGVSADEWQNVIRPILAKCLNVRSQQVRLEKIIEAKIIPQLYPHILRQKDGETNTSVWYEEYAESVPYSRFYGGDSEHGGFSDIKYCLTSDHWDRRAFRPLIVL